MLEGIPAISAMSLDQRTLVPQGEISGGEATVEKGATEAVGAEVETEVATVETEVGVAMVGIEEVAMVETEVVAMVETEEVAMEETEVVMVETEGEAMEEIEAVTEVIEEAMEAIEEAMEVIEEDMEETEAGGAMEETVVVVVAAVEATEETEVEATEETEVVAMEETEVGVMEETEVAMEETEVAMEAKWEEETTTEMISAIDHTDDCFEYSFVSDMIHNGVVKSLPAAFLMASWVVKLTFGFLFRWEGWGQFSF